MRKMLLVSLPLFIISCASNVHNVKQSNAVDEEATKVAKVEKSESNLVCEKRAQTGTRFVKKRCWTKEAYEERKIRDRELLRKARDTIQTSGGPSDL